MSRRKTSFFGRINDNVGFSQTAVPLDTITIKYFIGKRILSTLVWYDDNNILDTLRPSSRSYASLRKYKTGIKPMEKGISSIQ